MDKQARKKALKKGKTKAVGGLKDFGLMVVLALIGFAVFMLCNAVIHIY